MDNLYNPDQMSEQEVKDTFVARQPLVDELHSLVARQPDGAGVQHVVVIAPRGMGKTTLLRMVQFAVREDPDLAGRWLAIKFPEELFGVTDLADFWLETLFLISAETGDEALRTRAETLRRDYPESDRLREVGLAAIRDWRRKSGHRLLLLVENLDALFSKMRDDRDLAFLRDALMNDGTLMLVGGATTFFQEINDYGQPLYNFFKIHNLSDLKSDEIEELLSRRAQLDAVPDFGEKLAKNRSGLRAIEHFTGGNPRLALMLYRVVTQSDLGEVKVLLEKLLDEVTPYYKAKTESLPPQQQKILDAITRVSARTNQGVTPTEIAEIVRLAPNQVSSLLKRLAEAGYVRAANVREKRSYYILSEPLYALWHQMRFGRNERERFQWLVNWLKALYLPKEMLRESKLLMNRFLEELINGNLSNAQNVIEYIELFCEASTEVDEEIHIQLTDLYISAKEKIDFENFKAQVYSSIELLCERKFQDALISIEKVLSRDNEYPFGNWLKSLILVGLGKYPDSLEFYEKASKGKYLKRQGIFWGEYGWSQMMNGNLNKALNYFERALSLNSNIEIAWNGKLIIHTFIFTKLNKKEKKKTWLEIVKSFQMAKVHAVKFSKREIVSYFSNLIEEGKISFFSELFTWPGLKEEFFPLTCAIDYLLTGDSSLVEKLSPEVRVIVEGFVEKFRPYAPAIPEPPKKKKTPRKRVRPHKHL